MGGTNSKDGHWQDDSEAPGCHKCNVLFSISIRRHHCRNCGYVFCKSCSQYSCAVPMRGVHVPVRVCADCFRTLQKTGTSIGESSNYTNGWHGSSYSAPAHFGEIDASNVGHRGSFLRSDASVSSRSENDDNHLIGFGGATESGAASTVPGMGMRGESDMKFPEISVSAQVMAEKTAIKMEKERLVQRWVDVRQRAVFTDILLQEVEKVEVDTEVVYCLQIEGIKLQPEQAEYLRVMFPLPQPTEGNAELLMEPVDPCVPALGEERSLLDDALIELAVQITFPPPASLHKSDSILLHQF